MSTESPTEPGPVHWPLSVVVAVLAWCLTLILMLILCGRFNIIPIVQVKKLTQGGYVTHLGTVQSVCEHVCTLLTLLTLLCQETCPFFLTIIHQGDYLLVPSSRGWIRGRRYTFLVPGTAPCQTHRSLCPRRLQPV